MFYVAYFRPLGQSFGQAQLVGSEAEGLEFLIQVQSRFDSRGWQGVQSFESEVEAQNFINYQEGN